MHLTLATLLLASTTISQIAAAPLPFASSQSHLLQPRNEQIQNAADVQASTQDLATINTNQAADSKATQQTQNGVQKADAAQTKDSKDLLGLGLSLGGGGGGGLLGLGLGIGGGSSYPYPYPSYASSGNGWAYSVPCAGLLPAVGCALGGVVGGLGAGLGAILKRG